MLIIMVVETTHGFIMRYGIYFTFDEKTESALQELRLRLAREIAGIPSVEGKMVPHLMLLVFDSDNFESIMEKFKSFASGTDGFPIKLISIDAFEGRRNVVYTEPTISDKLKENFLRCLDVFSHADVVPAYRDLAHWKPHITLTKGIYGRVFRRAKELAEQKWRPLDGYVSSLGIINIQKPLDVLALKTLE